MSPIDLHVAPLTWAFALAVAVFAQPRLTLALLCAAALHELGHIAVLRLFNGTLKGLSFTPFGAEIRFAHVMSYGAEAAITAAGPAVNLLCAAAFAALGHRWEWAYLHAGVHTVLGLYNLLPVRPLDGERLAWIALAWCFGPYAADRVCAALSLAVSASLTALAAWLLFRLGGTPFFLLAASALFWRSLREIGLVKTAEIR